MCGDDVETLVDRGLVDGGRYFPFAYEGGGGILLCDCSSESGEVYLLDFMVAPRGELKRFGVSLDDFWQQLVEERDGDTL